MPRLTQQIYEQFEMNMNGTPVRFMAIQYIKPNPTCGPYRIKFQTWGEGAEVWSKIYDANFDLTKEQWGHFQHDINPTKPFHYYLRKNDQEEMNKVSVLTLETIYGDATHLGRGNSWNGYRIGAYVIKLSSIVPYLWQNSHAYLTVGESHDQAMREVRLNQTFMAHLKLRDRIAEITRVDMVGQKVAVTMPYLMPPGIEGFTELTSEQADYLEETLHRMHRLGYAYLDQELGYGLNEFKIPKIYDLSTVRHRSEAQFKTSWTDWINDDLSVIDRLREKHGLTRSRRSQLRADIRRKRHDKFMEQIHAKKNDC